MLDNLRDQDPASNFLQDQQADFQDFPEMAEEPRSRFGRLMGMTAAQRFIIAAMLLAEFCVLGVMFLVITGKIMP